MQEDLLRIALALVLGGLVGVEREYRDKAAGFRTMTLICLGSAIFTLLSQKIGGTWDPARIAANIVTGVGFLGGGVILHTRGHVQGLTTASSIWVVSGLGMAVGAGFLMEAVIATAAVLLVLCVFHRIENLLGRRREAQIYVVTCPMDPESRSHVFRIFEKSPVEVVRAKQAKEGREAICTFRTYGAPADHQALMAHLVDDERITAVEVT